MIKNNTITLLVFLLNVQSIVLFSKTLSKSDVFKSEIKLASLLKQYEYYDKSLNHYEELTQVNHSVSLYIDLGILYKEIGQVKKAENIIIDAIKEKPNNKELINALGDIYFESENYEKAKSYLIKIQKGNKSAINRLALLENRNNNYLEAIKYYYILVNEFNEKFQRINLAILHQKSNEIDKAEQQLLLFYKESTDKYYAIKYLIRFYKKYNKKEKLQEFMKELNINNNKKKKIMRPLLKSKR
jgi:tetratricopeptide (TPR) repeat protein